jgi:D-alanyl-D-alanine carboxypeptidase/D-alanyl-D-alanine-endopeptidase (penicillin-binding protein 4)
LAEQGSQDETGSRGPMPSRTKVGLIAGALALAFVLLGTGAVFAGIAAGKGNTPTAAGTGAKHGGTPTRTVPSDAVAASTIPTCSLAKAAGSAALQKLYGSVLAVGTNDSLYASNADDAQAPASAEKVLTAAAAISKLGPNFRITTSVVDGVTPGSITLVGQGDPTLSRVAAGHSVYGGAPTMASLAAKTLAAYNTAHPGVPITQVVLDASYWDPSDNWDSTVPRSEQTGGFLSETTALQVDGDRQNPAAQVSPRSTDPVMAAGNAFVSALGLSGVSLITGEAENGAPTLASVQSQPVYVLVKQMLLNSDNTLAETLARIISVKSAMNGSLASLAQAIPANLSKYGLDSSGIAVHDGSGESPDNQVPASYLAQLMGLVAQGKNGLNFVAAGIPVAGKTGSLATRFTGANADAAGHVSAKPGFIAGSYTLSGYTKAKDGTLLSFAFFAVGPGVSSSANGALDSLAATLYRCGKNLTSE